MFGIHLSYVHLYADAYQKQSTRRITLDLRAAFMRRSHVGQPPVAATVASSNTVKGLQSATHAFVCQRLAASSVLAFLCTEQAIYLQGIVSIMPYCLFLNQDKFILVGIVFIIFMAFWHGISSRINAGVRKKHDALVAVVFACAYAFFLIVFIFCIIGGVSATEFFLGRGGPAQTALHDHSIRTVSSTAHATAGFSVWRLIQSSRPDIIT